MIRLNLLKNKFQSSPLGSEPETLGSLTTMSIKSVGSGRSKTWLLAATGILLIGGIGAGVWYFLNSSTPDPVAPPTKVAKTVPPPAATPSKRDTGHAKDTAKVAKDTAKARDTAHAKVADAKPEPKPVPKPEPKPEPKPVPKPEPKKPEPPKPPEPVKTANVPPPVPSSAPQVVAPSLPGGVVNLVISESQGKASTSPAPTRFEDLSPSARLAYQKFSFERILSVLRQVSPSGLKYSQISVYSPGIVLIQGTTTDSLAVRALIQGLLAQSLVDTSLKSGGKNQFALVARLPFNSSFGSNGKSTDDFAKAMTQARDLAQAGGLVLAQTKAPSVKPIGALKRASWKLSGQGGWESVDKWLASLLSMECPIGFTSLSLSAGVEGKLRLEAEAISYSK